MKRRSFLKSLLGLAALPIASKAGIFDKSYPPEFIDAAKFDTAQGEIGKWNGMGVYGGRDSITYPITGAPMTATEGWSAFINGKEIPIEDVIQPMGSLRSPSYMKDGDLFELKSPILDSLAGAKSYKPNSIQPVVLKEIF